MRAEGGHMTRLISLTKFFVVAFLLVNIPSAAAQTYPSRPITMIVPFAAGGPTDVIARIVAEGMRPSMGQNIIIENVPGAGGVVGIKRVARSVPDGYTLSVGTTVSHVFSGAGSRPEYDLLNDFEPLSLISFQPFVIFGRREVPADNLKGLIELLRRNPDKLSAGTSAVGGPSHVASIFFQQATATHFRVSHYRGTGPALVALTTGEIDLLIESLVVFRSVVRNVNLKAFAIMAKSRLETMPDLPTVDESGAIGLYTSLWTALWAPKNTPNTIINELNSAVVKSLSDSTVRRRLAGLDQELPTPDQQTPQALAIFQKAEIDKWWPILKIVNATAQ
jgi:tripartite-type tricarboxylate transporter receptor subunit TctC